MTEKKDIQTTKEKLELKLFRQWYEEFRTESDRAAVVIGAAKLDLALRDLLIRKLLPNPSGQDELFDTDKPISTFSARINLACRLGLIDKTMECFTRYNSFREPDLSAAADRLNTHLTLAHRTASKGSASEGGKAAASA